MSREYEGRRPPIFGGLPTYVAMRYLPVLLVAFAAAGCDTSPTFTTLQDAKASEQGESGQGEEVVLATYDLVGVDSLDTWYDLWDPAGVGDHTVTFYHNGAELIAYRYTQIGSETSGVMKIETRWPGINREKVEFVFENEGVEMLRNELVASAPLDFVAAGQMKYNGTSIHKKPGSIRMDVGYGEAAAGWCRPPRDRRQVAIPTVTCTHMGVETDMPMPDADSVLVTSKVSGAQLYPVEGGNTTSE